MRFSLRLDIKKYQKRIKTVGKYTKIDFKRVAKDLGDVQDLVSNLQSKVDQEYSSDENVDQKTLAAQEKKEDEAPPEEASTEESSS